MIRQSIFFLTFCVAIGALLILYPSLIEIGVGITILLFGILNLENGFRIFTEGPVRALLRRSTDNLFKSINAGIISTAVLNSSSLISVLVISFISAELITLKAGIGVIFGSNIGTTFTVWLVALFGLKLEISRFALPMIIFGILFILQKNKNIKAWGYVIAGLGFFFLGIYYLKIGFEQYDFTLQLFKPGEAGFLALLIYTGIGMVATIILQSSAASLAIILTALSANQISYQDALALAIGTNIGTTFTAILGSLAASQAGKKLALAHLVFNVITGIVALIFLVPLSKGVDLFSSLVGISPNNYTLKLATFHTMFNILGVILLVPWINQLIALLNRIIKEAPTVIEEPKFLNPEILNHPQSAIHALYMETEHLLDHAFEILSHSLNVHRADLLKTEMISDVLKHSQETIDIDINEVYTNRIKHIYSKIIKYATLVQIQKLTAEEMAALSNIKNASRLIVKVIKDLNDLRKNLIVLIHSDNEYVRRTYNKFRERLLQIIRELFINVKKFPYQSAPDIKSYLVRQEKDMELIKKNIFEQKEKVRNLDSEINTIISDLISQNLIKSHMASSIWNDCIYVRRIGKNLLEIMELLYTEFKEPEFEN